MCSHLTNTNFSSFIGRWQAKTINQNRSQFFAGRVSIDPLFFFKKSEKELFLFFIAAHMPNAVLNDFEKYFWRSMKKYPRANRRKPFLKKFFLCLLFFFFIHASRYFRRRNFTLNITKISKINLLSIYLWKFWIMEFLKISILRIFFFKDSASWEIRNYNFRTFFISLPLTFFALFL